MHHHPLYTAIVALHGTLGLGALVTFWIAGMARKGSPLHRRVGRWYVWLIAGICVTSVPTIVARLARGEWGSAAFFALLLVLLGNAAWSATRAIRLKRDFAAYTGPFYRAVAGLTLAAGLGVAGLGVEESSVILMAFSTTAISRAMVMLHLIRQRAAPRPQWAVREHFGSMIGCGVATHVAFLLIGLGRVVPPAYAGTVQLVGWLGPLAVAGVAGVYFGRKYAPKTRSGGVPGGRGAPSPGIVAG